MKPLCEVLWEDLKVGDRIEGVDAYIPRKRSGEILSLDPTTDVVMIRWRDGSEEGYHPSRAYGLEYFGSAEPTENEPKPTTKPLCNVLWEDLRIGDRIKSHYNNTTGEICDLDMPHMVVRWEDGGKRIFSYPFTSYDFEYLGRAEPPVEAPKDVTPMKLKDVPWEALKVGGRVKSVFTGESGEICNLGDNNGGIAVRWWEGGRATSHFHSTTDNIVYLEKFAGLNGYEAELKNQIANLQAELTTAKKHYEEASGRIQELIEVLKDRDGRVAKLQTELRIADDKLRQHARKNDITTKQNELALAEFNELKADFKATWETCAKLQTELAATHKFYTEDADLAEARIEELTEALTFYRDIWGELAKRNSIDVLLDDRGKVATKALQTDAADDTEPLRRVQITVQDQFGYLVFVEKIVFDIDGAVCGTTDMVKSGYLKKNDFNVVVHDAEGRESIRVTVVAYNGDTQIVMLPADRESHIFVFYVPDAPKPDHGWGHMPNPEHG